MKDIIAFADFEKLELRVGQIMEASAPEWSQKLLEFHVDFGGDIGIKTIFSGVKSWYVPADFVNKKFPFVINLAERKMGEGVSQGMMLMVDTAEKPLPIPIDDTVPVGSILR